MDVFPHNTGSLSCGRTLEDGQLVRLALPQQKARRRDGGHAAGWRSGHVAAYAARHVVTAAAVALVAAARRGGLLWPTIPRAATTIPATIAHRRLLLLLLLRLVCEWRRLLLVRHRRMAGSGLLMVLADDGLQSRRSGALMRRWQHM